MDQIAEKQGKYRVFAGLGFIVFAGALLWMLSSGTQYLWNAWKSGGMTSLFSAGESAVDEYGSPYRQLVTKEEIAQAIRETGVFHEFPDQLELNLEGERLPVDISYTLDPQLQDSMEELMASYRPDYGAFVALDAQTGRVLAMVSYSSQKADGGHLALRATFPSASIFKVVTAAAAIAEHQFTSQTVIPFNGRNHTLYKSHILKARFDRSTRYMTLKEAFARSVNTVFAKIGAFEVGAQGLREYAERFGFNRAIASDVPVQQGTAVIEDDAWNLAEAASGYTRETTMSPLQGALIAAAVANDGVMMEPYVVKSIRKKEGELIYSGAPKVAGQTLSKSTAEEIRSLMRATVRDGTSKKSFRGFARGKFALVEVGGKTGSLTGFEPKGKYDWFVGYGQFGDRKIAVASLTIHERLWRVKSSYLARRSFETYFKDQLNRPRIAALQKSGL